MKLVVFVLIAPLNILLLVEIGMQTPAAMMEEQNCLKNL